MPYIDELVNSMDKLIQEQEANCENIPAKADIFSDYVRQCIDAALEQAKMKKDEVFQRIRDKIGTDMVNPFTEIESIDEQIQKTEEDRMRYSMAKDEYMTRINAAKDYELFAQYFESAKKKKKEENQPIQEPNLPEYQNVLSTAKRESEAIRNRIKNGNTICMIITLICMILDVVLLYQPFAAGNQASSTFTVLISLISAFSIDSLPTMIGMMSANIKNAQKMLSLKKAALLPVDSERRDLFQNKLWHFFAILITLLVFAGYILLRIILLVGGGDFNDGVQLFFVENIETLRESLEENNLSFTDGFSILPPIATSLFCFLFSIFNTVTESDCIDAFNLKIKEKLKQAREKCAEQEAICAKENENNDQSKQETMASIWSRYKQGNPLDDPKQFKKAIIAAALAVETRKYFGEYDCFCSKARSCAEMKIHTIKAKFSGYCQEPSKIVQLPTTAEEQDKLNYIWNTEGAQLEQTQEHIERLNESISDTIMTWIESDNNGNVTQFQV